MRFILLGIGQALSHPTITNFLNAMKKQTYLVAALLASSLSFSLAQDPGFQPPTAPTKPSAAAPAPEPSRGDEARGAGLIDNMDRLDATNPLQVNDRLSFRIVEEGNIPISGKVMESGDFQAPFVGLVKAAGKTPKALAYEIKTMLEGSYFRKATVIVALDERPKLPNGRRGGGGAVGKPVEFFTIYGQVIRQGKYELPFDEDVTVSQAVLRAGGFSQFANAKKVNG